jgi:hypothetical protein
MAIYTCTKDHNSEDFNDLFETGVGRNSENIDRHRTDHKHRTVETDSGRSGNPTSK